MNRCNNYVWCGQREHDKKYGFLNIKYPNTPIIQSSVSKIEKNFRETEHVKYVVSAGRPPINDNVLLSVAENPQIN